MKNSVMNVNKQNILYLIIYGGIIIIIVLVGILPLSLKISNQMKENENLAYKIKEQKDLSPVYASLMNAIKNKESFALAHPEKTALSRSEAGKFQNDFKIIARRSGLVIETFAPDINSSAGPSTSFLHNVVLRGNLFSLRKILVEMGAVSYIDRIEEINIQQSVTGAMEFRMKIWIALKA